MTTYTIKVEFPGGTKAVLTTTDRHLADLAYEGLNVTLPMGHKITLEMMNTTECLSVRNQWQDREGHWTERLNAKGPTP